MAADNRDNVKKREQNPKSLANLRPNPGGRPKQPKEFKELVKAHSVPALQAVIDILNNPFAKPMEVIKAAELIIDRAYGKAAQPIVGDNEHDPVNINLFNQEQRKQILEKYIALIGQNKV